MSRPTDPDRVWLVDWAGGTIGTEESTHRLVDLDGNTILEAGGVVGAFPAGGVDGGLVLQTESGISIWDTDTQTITQQNDLAVGAGLFLDANGNRYARCEGDCTSLYLGTVGTDRPATVTLDAGMAARAARFSPDGTRLAAITGEGIAVNDGAGGGARRLPVRRSELSSLAWSPDGTQLFAATYGYGEDQITIVR